MVYSCLANQVQTKKCIDTLACIGTHEHIEFEEGMQPKILNSRASPLGNVATLLWDFAKHGLVWGVSGWKERNLLALLFKECLAVRCLPVSLSAGVHFSASVHSDTS